MVFSLTGTNTIFQHIQTHDHRKRLEDAVLMSSIDDIIARTNIGTYVGTLPQNVVSSLAKDLCHHMADCGIFTSRYVCMYNIKGNNFLQLRGADRSYVQISLSVI